MPFCVFVFGIFNGIFEYDKNKLFAQRIVTHQHKYSDYVGACRRGFKRYAKDDRYNSTVLPAEVKTLFHGKIQKKNRIKTFSYFMFSMIYAYMRY